jgi:sugar phosphate isomerase/epimerase
MHFGFTTYQWGRNWDLPTLIANCQQIKAYGVELRMEYKSGHGVELETDPAKIAEIRKRFADSPVKVIGLATGERFDWVEPEKVKDAVEKAKRYAQLAHDVGASGIRVFPNDFHKGVPEEQTIAQIAKALNDLAKSAAGVGQQIRLENHGSAGRLTTIKRIFDQVPAKNVGVKLNSDAKDAVDGSFAANFNLVKNRLGQTLHFHDMKAPGFPYQEQADLLIDAGWTGWWFAEMEGKPKEDAVAELKEQRKIWDGLIEKSLARS